MTTECCGVEIAPEHRFCPKCGWEARAAAPAPPTQEPQEKNPPCQRCGGPHPFDTSVPSVRWNAVIRANGWPDYLCFTCIVQAFGMLAVPPSFTAVLSGGKFHRLPIEVRFNEFVSIDAEAIQQDNNALRLRIRELEAAAPAPPPLLAKAVADRDARPWRYYKLDHETMKKFCEKLADQCDNLLAAAPAPPPQEPNESEVMTNELPKMHLPRAQHGELVPGASATVGASCVWCGAPVEEPWCGNCEATTVRAAAPATPPQEPTKTCTCPLEHFPDRHDDHVPSCPRFKAAPAPPLQAADDWRTLTPEDMAIAEQEPKR